MERLLIYLAVAAAVFAVLLAARLKPQLDYCSEVRRLAAAVLAVNRSGGWIVDTFLIGRDVTVSGNEISHPGCGVTIKGVEVRSMGSSEMWRLKVKYDAVGRMVIIEYVNE